VSVTTGGEPERLSYEGSGMSYGALAWGPDDGPLALCMHGYPDTAWTWRFLGPALAADGWRVVAPFMRGYAPTDLAPDGVYQIGALARDVLTAQAALGGDERTVLIGHDWGAPAVYVAAATEPERFSRVVGLAVPPPAMLLKRPESARELIAELPVTIRQLRYSWYMGFQQLPVISERALPRLIPRLWTSWSPGYDASEDLAHLWESLDSPARLTASLRYYRALAQPWHRSPEYAREQRAIFRQPPQPILYLHGRDDGCMQAALVDRADGVLAPPSRVEVLSGCGHFLQLERPDDVNRRIAEFIRD
jgi:pimeloyl-ACP methyl ester carboxylesterase